MALNVIDIETVPSRDMALLAAIAAEVSHPKTMSKADTIARWNAEERPAAVEAAHLKTSVNPLYGEILSIATRSGGSAVGALFVDRYLTDPQIVRATYRDGKPRYEPLGLRPTEGENPSRLLLRTFFSDLSSGDLLPNTEWSGFNVEFDLRFLALGALRHRLDLPVWLPSLGGRYIDTGVDAMTAICGSRDKWESLGAVCAGLGIAPPVGKGSEVWGHVRAGRERLVAEHNLSDVEKTFELIELIERHHKKPKQDYWRSQDARAAAKASFGEHAS